MKTIVIIIGLQGSGKSTFYKQQLSGNFVRINLDTLHTRNNENREIERCVLEGKSFAVDNTNVTVTERKKYIDIAKENGYTVIGYFMESKLKDCIERNNRRTGKQRIPSAAIAATSNKMVLPSYEEGFDELYFVHNDGENMIIEKWGE